MTPLQHLRPEPVYRLSSELEDIVPRSLHTQLTNAGIYLVLSVVDRRRRAVNWVSVRPGAWQADWQDLSDRVKADIARFVERPEFEDRVKQHQEAIKAAGRPSAYSKPPEEVVNSAVKWLKGASGDSHDDLALAMSMYPMPYDLLSDGILFRRLEETRSPFTRADLKLLWDRGCYTTYPWVHATFSGFSKGHNGTRTGFYCQEARQNARTVRSLSKPSDPPHFGLQEVLLKVLGPTGTKKRPRVVSAFPILDGYSDDQSCGCLVAVVQAVRHSLKPQRALMGRLQEALRSGRGRLLAALRSSAFATILNAPVDSDGEFDESATPFITHFLEVIPHLQDFERAIVLRNGQTEYCFQRPLTPAGGMMGWERCGVSCPNVQRCRKAPLRVLKMEHDLSELLHVRLDPSVKELFNGLRLEFEYPRYCVLPQTIRAMRRLERHYLRDQLVVWRLVVQKVLEIRADVDRRRGAKATQAIAIIGRNLSHNIGSHVLSRLADRDYLAAATRDETDRGKPTYQESVRRLYSYLRERMDLVADLATTEPSWSVSVNLGDVLRDFKKNRLLLDTIVRSDRFRLGRTGIDQIDKEAPNELQLVFDRSLDVMVESPHGVMGEQALFGILENVMRNSAKHGRHQGNLELKLHMEPDESGGMLRLHIDDACGATVQTLAKINDILDRGFFKDKECREADPDGWGFKEMKMMAAFLRGHHAGLGEERFPKIGLDRNVPWVQADLVDDGRLRLTFSLYRPRLAAILVAEGCGGDLPFSATEGIRVFCSNDQPPPDLGYFKLAVVTPGVVLSQAWTAKLPVRRLQVISTHNALPVQRPLVTVTEEEWNGYLRDFKRDGSDKATRGLVQKLYSKWAHGLAHVAGLHRLKVTCAESSDQLGAGTPIWQDAGIEVIGPELGRGWWQKDPDNSAGAWQTFLTEFGLDAGCRAWFARHGMKDGIGNRASSSGKLTEEEILTRFEDLITAEQLQYFEAFDQGSPTARLWHYTTGEWAAIMAAAVAEAALVRVVIFDDRLAEWLKTLRTESSDERALRLMGIHIATPDSWNEANALNVEEWISRPLHGLKTGLLIVCVHQGVLEKVWHSPSDRELAERFGKWSGDATHVCPGRTHVVVHTGRGIPRAARVCRGVRGLGYSNLERHIRQQRSKLALVSTLLAATAGGE